MSKDDQKHEKEIAFVIALDGIPRLQLLGGTMEGTSAIKLARWILETFGEPATAEPTG